MKYALGNDLHKSGIIHSKRSLIRRDMDTQVG